MKPLFGLEPYVEVNKAILTPVFGCQVKRSVPWALVYWKTPSGGRGVWLSKVTELARTWRELSVTITKTLLLEEGSILLIETTSVGAVPDSKAFFIVWAVAIGRSLADWRVDCWTIAYAVISTSVQEPVTASQ